MRVPFTVGDVVRFLVICFIVGFFIRILGFGPVEFWLAVRDAIDWMWRHALQLGGNAVEYVLIGAAVVLPILLIRWGWNALKKR